MTAASHVGLVGMSVVALCACHCAPGTRLPGDHMSADYTLVPTAAGASRLYLGTGTNSMVAEHRDWLREAYHERASEAPGLVKLLGPDGVVKRVVSGWALGGPLANGEATWLEEVGEEYHYRIARSDGGGSSLTPPDDYWAVAGAVGHTAAPLGAVVLWRPARGASARDPAVRRDELWIAAIDRKTGAVLNTRELGVTLPWDRSQGVLVGGPSSAPILLLVGLPDPGGPGAYRVVGLRLPTLEVAWDAQLDIASTEASRAAPAPSAPGRAAIPDPGASRVSGDDLRTLYAVMGAPLGDGSGWLLAHGGLVGRVLVTDLTFVISADGKASGVPGVHLPGTDQIAPILDQPGVLVLGKAGARNDQHFVSIDAVWPSSQRIQTLADTRTQVHGRPLEDAPDLIPMSAAMRGGVLFVAPPVGGEGLGVDSADVRGLQTTPTTWHQADRPRVRARDQWLEDRARP